MVPRARLRRRDGTAFDKSNSGNGLHDPPATAAYQNGTSRFPPGRARRTTRTAGEIFFALSIKQLRQGDRFIRPLWHADCSMS
jgi:hypothetical protein